jgi:lipid II isoglutaminyl synthase (glutamine-hydrolysing)
MLYPEGTGKLYRGCMGNISPIDRLRLGTAVFVAKTITATIRTLKLGAASVLPGTIGQRLHPQILALLSRQIKHGVIVVAGTNGKTTTSLLLRAMLERDGWSVVHNEAGANLVNGLITTLLDRTNLFGNLKADFGILEVDENVIPLVLPQLQPRYIMALNLFRDQLDRYGEVDTIVYKWGKAIADLPTTTLVVNGDDPALTHLGLEMTKAPLPKQVAFFGLSEPNLYLEEIPHAVDSIYCPSCGTSLNYQGVYLSHQGDYQCPQCGFSKQPLAIESAKWPQVLIGVYNKYNTLAAITTAQSIGVGTEKILDTINNFQAAFGRAEELVYQGKKVRILLTKNPVGMNETIRAINQVKKAGGGSVALMILNDRTPDGTDVSWIWDVDTENFVNQGGKIVVSGDRVYDMALRLEYSKEQVGGGCELIVEPDLAPAVQRALDLCPANETLHIVPTYSAMLEVREILTGRKIL